jgi:hypothetical protein
MAESARVERLLHYSDKPLPAVLDDREQVIEIKPHGLWVSVEGEDDWLHWCQSEEFAISRLAVANEIRLAGGAKIIRLSSAAAIDAFTREWARPMPGLEKLAIGLFIDWPGVARQHDGIIIAPYVWSRRLSFHCRWYYGWDCASGCIWRVSAIAEIVRTGDG